MLVTNVGGLGEIVHHGRMGYAVEPTAEAIAEALLDYYTHDRQEAYTEYLKKEKNKYEWTRLTAAFMNILKG
jgi:glycosyltransferase involved in cell wall biosynthesis